MAAESFDAHYYSLGCGALPYGRERRWLDLFIGIARHLVQSIGPRSVLDAGCAMGLLVEALRDQGVEAEGVDISAYAISQVREDIRPYCRVGSILEPLPRRYDLITCIEVLEHLPPQAAEQAVAQLCQATEDVLFSSTASDYAEPTHLNVQPAEYWAELFARQGFVRDVDYDAAFITPWAVRFRRSQAPVPRLVRDYERRFAQLWKENTDLRAALRQSREHLTEMATSPAWELALALQSWRARWAPAGSRRERWLNQLVLKARGSARRA